MSRKCMITDDQFYLTSFLCNDHTSMVPHQSGVSHHDVDELNRFFNHHTFWNVHEETVAGKSGGQSNQAILLKTGIFCEVLLYQFGVFFHSISKAANDYSVGKCAQGFNSLIIIPSVKNQVSISIQLGNIAPENVIQLKCNFFSVGKFLEISLEKFIQISILVLLTPF